MAERSGRRAKRGGMAAGGGEFVDMVVAYAKQETLGPLRGLGRFVAFGVSGSIALSVGLIFLLVALLRALQTETGSTFRGHLTWLPYLITAGAAVCVIGLSVWRITKGPAARTADRDRGQKGRGR